MDMNEARRIQINFSIGLFLIVSGAAIQVVITDTAYGLLCLGIGVVFLAKSLAEIRLYSER